MRDFVALALVTTHEILNKQTNLRYWYYDSEWTVNGQQST